MLYVCFGCAVAARWGPCEHMYSFMLERGDINRCQIPQPKPKGRPRSTKPQAPAPARPNRAALSAGPATQPRPASLPTVPEAPSQTQQQQELCRVLREAGCGRYAPTMIAQGATLPMLATLELRDYIAIFGMQLNEAWPLMQTLQVRPSALLHWVWSSFLRTY